jgi:hypothetical protein
MYSFTRCVTPQQAAMRDRHQERRQQNEQHADPVDAHLVLQAEQPLRLLHQLEAGVVGVELHQDEDRHEERGQRRRKGQPLGVQLRRLVIAAQEHGHDDGARPAAGR